MDRNQKIVLITLAAVVIVGGTGIVLYQKKHSQNTGVLARQDLAKKTDAPVGQVIVGFPRELLLDSKATPDQSYNMDYSKQNQYTVNLISAMSPKDLYGLYQSYFKTNGYNLVNQNHTSANLQSIYAIKDNVEVNVVANKKSDGKTSLTLTYLQK
ncbi:MAG: hypothetical protein JWO40_61 [Candidatus Doudnabacteria bacterium]|nr:hypothetical protein [Candidatus Doudnabacteria bacterium]